MKQSRRTCLVAFLVALCLLLAACSNGNAHAPSATPQADVTSNPDTTPDATPAESTPAPAPAQLPTISTKMKPGTYTKTTTGMHDGLVVEVTLGELAIENIVIKEHHETAGVSDAAIEKMPVKLVETQNLGVDTVAGATMTSNAIIEAVREAIAEAGGNPDEFSVATQGEASTTMPLMVFPEVPSTWDETHDVVVVGGGFAGLAAAYSASEAGADVILVEKMPLVGGNSAICGGEVASYTSKLAADLQKKHGYEVDTAEHHIEDTMTGGDNLNDRSLVEVMVKGIPYYLDVLIDNGLVFQDMLAMLGGHTGYRTYESENLVGTDITSVQERILKERNIPIQTETKMVEIYRESAGDRRVVGLRVQLADGSYKNIEAKKGVILATGGFGANVEMREMNVPYLGSVYPTTNNVCSTGEGITLAQVVGASTIQMDRIQRYPFADPETGILDYAAVIPDSASAGLIYVDVNGNRYVNESERRDVNADASLATGGTTTFTIFTKDIMQKVEDDLLQDAINKGRVIYGETLEALVTEINARSYQGASVSMDASVLEKTINTHNGYIKNGSDAEFKKTITPSMMPMEKGPYYAIPQWPSVHHTMGGLSITPNAEVKDIYQEPIPGLFAAGEVTGAVHGGNRLGSNAIADACTFGYVAGHVATTGETPTHMFEKYN